MKKLAMACILVAAVLCLPAVVSADECYNLPTLHNFQITEADCSPNSITMTFTPNGESSFQLHLSIHGGVLETWCTGDEDMCFAVGNGRECSGEPLQGWCYNRA